jgi:Aminopeptidase N
VTLDNFTHIWLNEGFATYGEALYIGHRDSVSNPSAYADYVLSEMNWYFTYGPCQNQWGYPIVPPYSLFGCNSYTKGGLVLHMLRGVLGDSLFFEGLRQYGQQYGYGNAVTQDFQNVMEAVTGQDLTWFFQEWVYAPGFPYYLYAWDWRAGTLRVWIRQVQRDSVDAGVPYFEMPIRLRLHRALQGDTVVVVRNHAVEVETLWVMVQDSVTGVLLDDGNWILEKHMQVPTGVSEGVVRGVPRIRGMRFVRGGMLEVEWEGPAMRVPVRVVDMLGRERWHREVMLRRGRQRVRVGGLPGGGVPGAGWGPRRRPCCGSDGKGFG